MIQLLFSTFKFMHPKQTKMLVIVGLHSDPKESYSGASFTLVTVIYIRGWFRFAACTKQEPPPTPYSSKFPLPKHWNTTLWYSPNRNIHDSDPIETLNAVSLRTLILVPTFVSWFQVQMMILRLCVWWYDKCTMSQCTVQDALYVARNDNIMISFWGWYHREMISHDVYRFLWYHRNSRTLAL